MKFKKPSKTQLKSNAATVIGGGAGLFGASYGRAKLAPKLAKVGGEDTYDLGVTALGITAAASATGSDNTSKIVRGAGLGAAINGIYSFGVRKYAQYKAKKAGANMPQYIAPALNSPQVDMPVIEVPQEETIDLGAYAMS